jgi:hypothetical protein
METIGQLTGGIAHDFNNLLMAVIGNLDLLRRRMPEDPGLRRLVDGAMQGAQRGAALTQRLLAFARKRDLNSEAVDVITLIQDMRQLLTRSVGPLVDIVFCLSPGLPAAQVDPNQLELAILNLSVNARDAMPNGGRITVGLDQAEVGAELSGDLKPGKYLRISVRDTGIGMDERTLCVRSSRSFRPRSRARAPAFVYPWCMVGCSDWRRATAVQQAGRRHIRGTALAADRPAADRTTREEASARAPPSTILVVDDDALISMSTADMLEDLGHRVIKAPGWRSWT